jgi:ubiquinone/menaquinone biosynthesis C-methylase UbiE
MIHVQEDADPRRWHRTGSEFLHYSRVLAGLRPSDSVLDVGCGAGRMAMAFATYLQPQGRYEGFDVHKPSIAWAQQAYRQPRPHFHFQYLDVSNTVYNPQGTEQGARLRFPYDDGVFDFTLLTSIFTHMLPREVAHYWQEIARTLKPGGHALVTALLIKPDSRLRLTHSRNTIPLPHHRGLYRIQSLYEPERVVAYDVRAMFRMIAQAGLTLVQVYNGSWCGRKVFLSYQDIMIVQRTE